MPTHKEATLRSALHRMDYAARAKAATLTLTDAQWSEVRAAIAEAADRAAIAARLACACQDCDALRRVRAALARSAGAPHAQVVEFDPDAFDAVSRLVKAEIGRRLNATEGPAPEFRSARAAAARGGAAQ